MNKHTMKILSNEYKVPYPDELVYRDCLFLKDYRLNEMPVNAGDEIEGDYLQWLQEYLYRCEISLTVEQSKIQAYILKNSSVDTACLGDIAGRCENAFARHPCYEFPDNFEQKLDFDSLQGTVYDDPYEDYLEGFDDDEKQDSLSKRDYILEDYGYYVVRSQDEHQFRSYWPNFTKIEAFHWIVGRLEETNMENADFAWRVYLSLLLKSIPERAVRIEHLERFYLFYEESLHK